MIDKLEPNRLNELSEYIVLDYLRQQHIRKDDVVCVDMDGLASDYFGLTVVYENIAEEDKSKTAFAPNGFSPLQVSRNGQIVSVVFPASCIVLDRYYRRAENSTARRFTLGHELGHKLLAKVAPEHNRGNYQTIFDKERKYTLDELKNMLSMEETQANQVSAAFLMPMFLLKTTLKRVMGSTRFPVYGNFQMLPADSLRLKRMADDLGVAAKTLAIRLRDCKMIEYRSMEDYIRQLRLGGDCGGICGN